MLKKYFAATSCLTILVLFFLEPIPSSASADFQSARTIGLGGAGHAGPMLTDAIFLNPSYASFIPNSIFTGSMGSPEGRGPNYSVAVQDGHGDFAFQAGVAYTRRADANIISFGAAKSFIRRMGFGIGGKWVVPTDPSRPQFADSTLSISGLIGNWLQTSLVIHNLIQTSSASDLNFYREIVIGSKINLMDIVLIYLDPHFTPALPTTQAWGAQLGLEFPILKDFFIRGGLFKNAALPQLLTRGDGFGVGGGWLAPRLAIDYGFQRAWRTLNAPEGFVHQVSLSVFF